MEITEVRIKLMESAEDRLRGFCSVTFDGCFVIRDLKIIEGHNGPFVAMPSRKLTSNCGKCRTKNHLRAHYCNNCGQKLRGDAIQHDSGGRAKLYADIAHPINASCREMIQNRVILELENEVVLSKEPGYRSRYDEAYDDASRSNRSSRSSKNSADSRSGNQSSSSQSKTEAPAEKPNSQSSDPNPSDQKPSDQGDSQRADDKHSSVAKPNPSKDQDVSSGRSKPLSGEFGQGIFD